MRKCLPLQMDRSSRSQRKKCDCWKPNSQIEPNCLMQNHIISDMILRNITETYRRLIHEIILFLQRFSLILLPSYCRILSPVFVSFIPKNFIPFRIPILFDSHVSFSFQNISMTIAFIVTVSLLSTVQSSFSNHSSYLFLPIIRNFFYFSSSKCKNVIKTNCKKNTRAYFAGLFLATDKSFCKKQKEDFL